MTRTVSPPRQPRGWDQLIAQINAATQRGVFLQQMLDLQIRIVAGEYGALWEAGPDGQLSLSVCWPAALHEQGEQTDLMKMLRQGAQTAMQQGASQVLKLETPGQTPGPSGAHLFVTIFRAQGKPVGCSVVVADCRDAGVIHTTIPLREMAAGLFEAFAARHEAASLAREAQHVRQAMAVLAVAQEGEGFNGSAFNFVNELARQLNCDRVSLGWAKANTIKLIAVSDSDQAKRQSEDAALLEMAMAECLDQQQPLLCPIPPQAEPILTQAVIFSHRKLVGGRDDRHVLSLPLRDRDKWLGAFTLERTGQPFDPALVQRLQLIADVLGPELSDRYDSDRWLVGHAWRSCEKSAALLIGPRHVGWKLAGLAALVLFLLTLLVSWPYRISPAFRLEAHQKRILPAPYQGKIAAVHVLPGDTVKAGDLLAELDAVELRLQLAENQGRLKLAQVEYNQAQAEKKQTDAAKAAANIQQVQARVDLLTHQIASARILAPIDGVVLEGSWKDKVGSVVELGSGLFEIAPLTGLTPVLRVPEADVDLLLEATRPGAAPLRGELATRSVTSQTFTITYDRIVPLGKPVEGQNVFEVWCRLDEPAPWMRPGMEGIAKLEVSRKPVFWILTHKLVDAARLWLWW